MPLRLLSMLFLRSNIVSGRIQDDFGNYVDVWDGFHEEESFVSCAAYGGEGELNGSETFSFALIV